MTTKPDPQTLHVFGIHVLAVLILGDAIAKLTGQDKHVIVAAAFNDAKRKITEISPQQLQQYCNEALSAANIPPDES